MKNYKYSDEIHVLSPCAATAEEESEQSLPAMQTFSSWIPISSFLFSIPSCHLIPLCILSICSKEISQCVILEALLSTSFLFGVTKQLVKWESSIQTPERRVGQNQKGIQGRRCFLLKFPIPWYTGRIWVCLRTGDVSFWRWRWVLPVRWKYCLLWQCRSLPFPQVPLEVCEKKPCYEGSLVALVCPQRCQGECFSLLKFGEKFGCDILHKKWSWLPLVWKPKWLSLALPDCCYWPPLSSRCCSWGRTA